MLDRQQAEAAAEALLAEHRVRHAKDGRDVSRARRLAVQRRAGGWGLVGLAVGALAGHLAFGGWPAGGFVGFALGAVAGRWIAGRSATAT